MFSQHRPASAPQKKDIQIIFQVLLIRLPSFLSLTGLKPVVRPADYCLSKSTAGGCFLLKTHTPGKYFHSIPSLYLPIMLLSTLAVMTSCCLNRNQRAVHAFCAVMTTHLIFCWMGDDPEPFRWLSLSLSLDG